MVAEALLQSVGGWDLRKEKTNGEAAERTEKSETRRLKRSLPFDRSSLPLAKSRSA